jgi:RimJ/RimL family protein N-acetyltransferase
LTLSDGVVLLRPWRLGDLACVRAASEDPVIPDGTTVPRTWSDEAGRAWIERQWTREPCSLAIAPAGDGDALGCAVLLHRATPGVVGLGYWVIGPARGRGLAARAVRLLRDWALGEGGLVRVEAHVEPGNVASERALRAAGGFEREGALRSYLLLGERRADAIVYASVRP